MSPPAVRRPVVLVTGLSGAGKASILRVLEDLGHETMDNPPLDALASLVAEGRRPLALGVDSRTRGFTAAAALAALANLRADPALAPTLVFATADATILLRRYTETRRRHPLAEAGTVAEGIAREEALLEPLGEAADWVVDTTDLPLPELRRRVEERFRPGEADGRGGLGIAVVSFAFPHGLPREADLVFDLRFLRNPHYVPRLRPLTGLDPEVAAHVEADPEFAPFLARLTGFVDPLLPRFVAEGKKYLTVAVGCTGGRHRSVLVAERLAAHLRGLGWRAASSHRGLPVPGPVGTPPRPERAGTAPEDPPDPAGAHPLTTGPGTGPLAGGRMPRPPGSRPAQDRGREALSETP